MPGCARRATVRALLAPLLLAAALLCRPAAAQPAAVPVTPPGDTGISQPEVPADLDRQILENQQDLEQTQKKMAEVRDQLAQLEAREKSGLAKLSSLDQQIRLTTQYLRQLQAQATARTLEIADVARKTSETEQSIATRRRDLGRRLTAIYKYGRLLPLETVLSTRSLPEVYRRMFYLRWIARADEKLSRELTELDKQLVQQRGRLAVAHAELERLQAERVAQGEALNSARRAESELLRKTRTEKETSTSLARQLEESAKKLTDLIGDLERRRRAAAAPTGTHYFETNRGRLPWPLRGRVIAAFGSQVHPRYKTKTSNLGIDIKPAAPGPVTAIAAGRVAYADQFMGYGNLVIVDHQGGFYTLYSNLDEMSVSVGSDVLPGTTVGTVSDYLHFEIRQDGRPVNPSGWLSR